MNAYVIKNADVSYLNSLLLDERGLVRVLPTSEIRKIPTDHIKIWLNQNGVYCLPTLELIDWIRERIDGRKAIEVCAGNGAIGRALGIPATDSYAQQDPSMAAYYSLIGQKPTQPPADVYKFEANEAVDVLKPKVVVASYATQKYLPGDEGPPAIGSCIVGIDELAMLPKIETYILVGNDRSHADKRIGKFPHETFRFDWIVTRAVDQSTNFIRVWDHETVRQVRNS